MTEKSQAYFQELTENEKVSKLSQLARSNSEVTVWEKGSSKRENFAPSEFKKIEGRFSIKY
jgi:hypothetical protein